MYKLNILLFVNKNWTIYFIKRDCVCWENYNPTNYKLQSFMKKVTDVRVRSRIRDIIGESGAMATP